MPRRKPGNMNGENELDFSRTEPAWPWVIGELNAVSGTAMDPNPVLFFIERPSHVQKSRVYTEESTKIFDSDCLRLTVTNLQAKKPTGPPSLKRTPTQSAAISAASKSAYRPPRRNQVVNGLHQSRPHRAKQPPRRKTRLSFPRVLAAYSSLPGDKPRQVLTGSGRDFRGKKVMSHAKTFGPFGSSSTPGAVQA